MVCLSLSHVLKSSDKRKLIPSEKNEIKVFFDKYLIQKLFNTLIHKDLGIIIVFKYSI